MGVSGYSGYSGISGFSGMGISGYSGYSGKSGYSGYSGISGVSGYSGYSGISGLNGNLGLSGFSGFSGYSGYSGKSGYSGYSGSGKSGYSGYSGAQGLYGASSLILNGGGACTTDWLGGLPPTYWEGTGGAVTSVITGSGFTNNAYKIVVGSDFSLSCGAVEQSYILINGVTYTLTFDYKSSVALNVFGTVSAYTYGTYAASPSAISGVTLTFTAADNDLLLFGADGTRSELAEDDWWIIDKVTLRCGDCGGGLIINDNGDERMLTSNGGTTSIDAEPTLTYDGNGLLNMENNGIATFQLIVHEGNAASAPMIKSIRTRGTTSLPTAPVSGDTLYDQYFIGTYGTGTTLDKQQCYIGKVSERAMSDYNIKNPTAYSQYKVSMYTSPTGTYLPIDRLIIDSAGMTTLQSDVTIIGSLYADIAIVNQSQGAGAFTSLINITGNTYDVIVTLPSAASSKGVILVFVIASVVGGSSRKGTISASGSDKIGIGSLTSKDLTVVGACMILQSDGTSRWHILHYLGSAVQ
jgi:hypothetical protein